MDNFIPKAFTQEKDECPVCLARLDLEATMPQVAASLDKLLVTAMQDGVGSAVCRALLDLHSSFGKSHADYRVAFSLNLSIWFSAERFGRVKKVPDLILAYEEYRGEASKSLSALKAAVQNLQQVCLTDAEGEVSSHDSSSKDSSSKDSSSKDGSSKDSSSKDSSGNGDLSNKGKNSSLVIELSEFLTAFNDFQTKAERFWLEVDKWTDKRREDAFKVV
ncbi:MAG: hypothetical protein BWY75_01232 [bacterium ADurb.Bin425]|nr:MAG: hypothetical protein BWY75_01232 [bacterium ADurb.Bin425]